MALSQAIGETWLGIGWRELSEGRHVSAFLNLIRANAAFPLVYPTREAIAALHGIANELPPEINIEAIDRALKADPWSGHLLWYKAMQELRWANLPEADAALRKLERIGRDWPETVNARQVFEAVRARIAEVSSAP